MTTFLLLLLSVTILLSGALLFTNGSSGSAPGPTSARAQSAACSQPLQPRCPRR